MDPDPALLGRGVPKEVLQSLIALTIRQNSFIKNPLLDTVLLTVVLKTAKTFLKLHPELTSTPKQEGKCDDCDSAKRSRSGDS